MPTTTTETSFFPQNPSEVEQYLTNLARTVTMKVFGLAGANTEDVFQAARNPAITPELQSLVQGNLQSTLGTAQGALAEQFRLLQNSIYESAAARGGLNSSFVASNTANARDAITQQMAGLAGGAQQQASGQLFQGALANQQANLSMAQLYGQINQGLMDPALLGRLMAFRLNTATQKTKSQDESGPLAAFGILGNVAGSYLGAK